MTELAERDPAAAAARLEERLAARPETDGALALAELSYRAGIDGQGRDPEKAVAYFRDGASLAALSLREPGGTRPDLAIEVHNRSVARMIRIAQKAGRDQQARLAAGPGRPRRRPVEPDPRPRPGPVCRPRTGRGSPGPGDGPHLQDRGAGDSARGPPDGRDLGLARPARPVPPPRASPGRDRRRRARPGGPGRSGLAARAGDARPLRPVRRPRPPLRRSRGPARGRPDDPPGLAGDQREPAEPRVHRPVRLRLPPAGGRGGALPAPAVPARARSPSSWSTACFPAPGRSSRR